VCVCVYVIYVDGLCAVLLQFHTLQHTTTELQHTLQHTLERAQFIYIFDIHTNTHTRFKCTTLWRTCIEYALILHICETLILHICETLILHICETLILHICETLILHICDEHQGRGSTCLGYGTLCKYAIAWYRMCAL